MVGQAGVAAYPEQQHETGQAAVGQRGQPARVGQQVPVDGERVGVGDHHVGGHGRVDPGQAYPVHPATGGVDPGDRLPGAHRDAQVQAAGEQRVGQGAQPAAQVPATEGQLGVGDGDQRGRGAARVRAGVGGVAVQQHPQPGFGQVAAAQPAQGAAGADRGQVAQPPGQRGQVARRVDGPPQDVPVRRRPDPGGPPPQPLPVGGGPVAEGGPDPGGELVRVGARVEGRSATGEDVPHDRIQRDQVEVLVELRAGRLEQLVEDLRQGEQARPGVEVEAARRGVVDVAAELAADGVGPFEDGHLVPADRQPGGGGQPAHAGADDHDPRHAASS